MPACRYCRAERGHVEGFVFHEPSCPTKNLEHVRSETCPHCGNRKEHGRPMCYPCADAYRAERDQDQERAVLSSLRAPQPILDPHCVCQHAGECSYCQDHMDDADDSGVFA